MVSKFFVFILFSIIYFSLYSQNENSFVKKGCIKTMLTLSPTKMLSKNLSPFYLHGSLEYYAESTVSVSGEGYYYFGDLSEEKKIFNFHHSLFFGANFHHIKNNSDFYIGFQPAISITQIKPDSNNTHNEKTSVNPLISIPIGFNFFINKYFHFFIQNRWVFGENINTIPFNISDTRMSAGLGLHL